MAEYLTNTEDLTTVANAIRTKGGTQAQLSFPDGFAAAISNLSSGGSSQITGKTIDVTIASNIGVTTTTIVSNDSDIAEHYADENFVIGIINLTTSLSGYMALCAIATNKSIGGGYGICRYTQANGTSYGNTTQSSRPKDSPTEYYFHIGVNSSGDITLSSYLNLSRTTWKAGAYKIIIGW